MKESSESHQEDNRSTSEAADDSQHDADADASNHSNNDKTATAIEDLKQVWMVQQKEIAAAVIALEDDDDNDIVRMPRLSSSSDDANSDAGDNDPSPSLFRLVDLNDNADLTGTRLVGGTDVSFPTTDDGDAAPAVAVYTVLRVADHAVVYCAHRFFTLQVPYVPSFLAFREIEPLAELIEEQRRQSPHLTPDVILVDGNGVWHERSAGLASALGVRLDIPTIGVGKTLYNAGGWHRGLLEPGLVTHVLRQAVRQLIPDESQLQQQQHQQQVAADHDPSAQCFPDGFFIAWMRQSIDANMAQKCLDDNVVASSSSSVPQSAAPSSSSPPPPDAMMVTKGELVRRLSSATRGALRGVAFRLVGHRHDDDDDDDHPLCRPQQCAVVLGHGGRNNNNIGSSSSSQQQDTAVAGGGCHKPVFVSIGHKVSLQHAVALVCHLSSVRIPEPIRQADLRGRALMRNQKEVRK